jgi:hypothetical protein
MPATGVSDPHDSMEAGGASGVSLITQRSSQLHDVVHDTVSCRYSWNTISHHAIRLSNLFVWG